jgi:hypothetical protein
VLHLACQSKDRACYDCKHWLERLKMPMPSRRRVTTTSSPAALQAKWMDYSDIKAKVQALSVATNTPARRSRSWSYLAMYALRLSVPTSRYASRCARRAGCDGERHRSASPWRVQAGPQRLQDSKTYKQFVERCLQSWRAVLRLREGVPGLIFLVRATSRSQMTTMGLRSKPWWTLPTVSSASTTCATST